MTTSTWIPHESTPDNGDHDDRCSRDHYLEALMRTLVRDIYCAAMRRLLRAFGTVVDYSVIQLADGRTMDAWLYRWLGRQWSIRRVRA